MKKTILSLIIIFLMSSCYATEYSDFASKQYSEQHNIQKVRITVKKEHIEEYAQEIGSTFVPYIAYGYGDIRGKKLRKKRISYICLLNSELIPLWSYVIPR